MENELDCLGDIKGHDGHLAKNVFVKILFRARVSRLPCRDLAVFTKQQLAISGFISKRNF